MLERLREMRERRRAGAEIDALSQRDLDETGLSRGALHAVAGAPAAVVVRQGRMAERFGLTEVDFRFNRQDFAAILAQCASCRSAAACARFLDDPQATAAEARFCPNRDLYLVLARPAAAV